MELYIMHIICSMRMDQPYLLIEKAGPQEASTVGAEGQGVKGKNSGTVCSILPSVDVHSKDSSFISNPVASLFPVQCKAHGECLEAKSKNDYDGTCSHCSSSIYDYDSGSVTDKIIEKVDNSLSRLMKGKTRLQSIFQKFTPFGTENSKLKECPFRSNPVIHSTTTDEDSTTVVDFAYKKIKQTSLFKSLDIHQNIGICSEENSDVTKHSMKSIKSIHTLKEATKKPSTFLRHQMSFKGGKEHDEVNISAILSEEIKNQYSDVKVNKHLKTSIKFRSHDVFQTSQLDDYNDLRTPGTCHREVSSTSGKDEAIKCILKMDDQSISGGQCELSFRKVQNIDLAAPWIIDVPEVTMKIKMGEQRLSCQCSQKQFCMLHDTESQLRKHKRREKITLGARQLSENVVSPSSDNITELKYPFDAAHLETKGNDDMVCLDLPLTNFGFYSGEVLILM